MKFPPVEKWLLCIVVETKLIIAEAAPVLVYSMSYVY